MELKGKVVVVTGAGSGIGRACALALADQGADIVAADGDRGRLDAVVAQLSRRGVRSIGLRTDVSKDSHVRNLARDGIAAMGQVDVLINDASLDFDASLEQLEMDDWERIIQTNLLGVVRTARAFAPQMVERGGGHIISTASFGALVPDRPATIAYDTSKSGVIGFSQALAAALAPAGVAVSVLCYGYIRRYLDEEHWIEGVEGLTEGADTEREVSAAEIAGLAVDGLHHRCFLILSDPSGSELLAERWRHLDREAVP